MTAQRKRTKSRRREDIRAKYYADVHGGFTFASQTRSNTGTLSPGGPLPWMLGAGRQIL